MSYWNDFLTPLHNTLQRIVSFVPRMLVALILLAVFWAVATVARNVARRSLKRFTHIPWAVRLLIIRAIYLGTIVVGILVALSAANIDVTTLIASLGVAGFALGFALKDILENFIAGILLLFARPFEIGDQVKLGDYEGTVTDIQIRTTTLHTYNGEQVFIPNSNVFSNPVVNHTRLGKRRYTVDFDTSLTADSAVVERESLKVMRQHKDIAEDPEPFLRVVSVDTGNDVLSWRMYFWSKPVKAVEVSTVSEVLASLKKDLFDAGVPTPTSTSAMIVHHADQKAEAKEGEPEEGEAA